MRGAGPFSTAGAAASWFGHDPQLLAFLQELETREDWVSSDAAAGEQSLVELMNYLSTRGRPLPANVVSLVRLLAALPYGRSIHALLRLDARAAPVVQEVLSCIYDQRELNVPAGLMWQRLQRMSRYQVISGLFADLAWPDRPLHGARCARRPAVALNRDTLPFLQEQRSISALNEVDELFGNGRFYLLTGNMELCRTLASCGARIDQLGGYVERESVCDFEKLDQWLPYVARRAIKPLFGDLIPHSSWGSNLSRLLTRGSWDRIRRPVIAAKGQRCEICGAKDVDGTLDCHEQWEYYEPLREQQRGVQKLIGLWVMCSDCHATQHLGSSNARNADALERLRRIGRMSERELQAYRAFVFDRRARRSRMEWVLDVSILSGFEPLIIQSSWTLDADGFLNHSDSARSDQALRSQTVVLGAAWRFSAGKAMVHPVRSAEDSYYE